MKEAEVVSFTHSCIIVIWIDKIINWIWTWTWKWKD